MTKNGNIVILSIDGGGLRGIIPVKILQFIKKIVEDNNGNARIENMFDFVSGTSTGGLIACALTVGENGKLKYGLDDIENVYVEDGPTIFPIRTGINRFLHNLTDLWEPEFKADGLEGVLKKLLGESRILDCLLPILIPTYDIYGNQTIFFNQSTASDRTQNANAFLFDVCRATSAGPTYLPPHDFIYGDSRITCIDGGTFMNNPAVGMLVHAHECRDFYKEKYGYDIKEDYSNVYLLSLGTGHYTDSITDQESVKWGQYQWIQHLIDIMMQGASRTVDHEVPEIIGDDHYLRLNVKIKNAVESDMADARTGTRHDLVELTNLMLADSEKDITTFLKAAGLI